MSNVTTEIGHRAYWNTVKHLARAAWDFCSPADDLESWCYGIFWAVDLQAANATLQHTNDQRAKRARATS